MAHCITLAVSVTGRNVMTPEFTVGVDLNKHLLCFFPSIGIAVDYPNDTGQTALFCACFEAQEQVVSLLLSRGADPNT